MTFLHSSGNIHVIGYFPDTNPGNYMSIEAQQQIDFPRGRNLGTLVRGGAALTIGLAGLGAVLLERGRAADAASISSSSEINFNHNGSNWNWKVERLTNPVNPPNPDYGQKPISSVDIKQNGGSAVRNQPVASLYNLNELEEVAIGIIAVNPDTSKGVLATHKVNGNSSILKLEYLPNISDFGDYSNHSLLNSSCYSDSLGSSWYESVEMNSNNIRVGIGGLSAQTKYFLVNPTSNNCEAEPDATPTPTATPTLEATITATPTANVTATPTKTPLPLKLKDLSLSAKAKIAKGLLTVSGKAKTDSRCLPTEIESEIDGQTSNANPRTVGAPSTAKQVIVRAKDACQRILSKILTVTPKK